MSNNRSIVSVYTKLARLLMWKPGTQEWEDKREEQIDSLLCTAPTGAGICSFGMTEDSRPDRIVFEFSYHHTDDENPRSYGYTDHKVILRPCPAYGYSMRVTGWEGDRRTYGTLDYLADTFRHWLDAMVYEHPTEEEGFSFEPGFYELWSKSLQPVREPAIW